jgi:hypothetical protein
MKEALRRERAFRQRQTEAAIQMQRLVRGHLARVLMVRMKEYLRQMITQAKACLHVQTSMRRFLARKEAEKLRKERDVRARWNAAIKIQSAFRGSRGRHIFAVLISLHALNAVENAAAVAIQVGCPVLVVFPVLCCPVVRGVLWWCLPRRAGGRTRLASFLH